MGRHKINLSASEQRALMSNVFMIRSHGLRTLSISALASTRLGARRTLLMRRLLRRTLAMVERVLAATDRSGGPQSCWEFKGKLRRDRQPVCYFGKNPRCVRRLISEFCGCPLPAKIRLRMLPGCTPRCCNPKHCLNHLEATSGKAK